MTDSFGLDETELLRIMERLVGERSRSELLAHFARATWTGIAEPGDGVAGTLVQTLGEELALRLVIEKRDADVLRSALIEAGELGVERENLEKAIARWAPRLTSRTALIAVRQAERFRVRFCAPGDEHWPTGVDDLGPHAPIGLWVRGNDSTLATLPRSIALVGARAATGYGEHVAMEASAGLVDRGFTIVSGAAYGIDGMAHRAALASSGQTVAFLAGGVDRFYPAGHESLLTRIVAEGVVVSELPCGSSPTKWRFLQRNRLIAASSRATVVLEAGRRSGSLNTAGHAAALGRPLGAVPGPVTSAASAGCHRLLREFEATCVTGPDEMAELVAEQSVPAEGARGDGSMVTRVLDAMSSRSPRTVDEIAARSGLAAMTVRAALGEFELDGRAVERAGGWLSRNPRQSR